MTRFARYMPLLLLVLFLSGAVPVSALAQNPAAETKSAAVILSYRGFDDLAFLHTRNLLAEKGFRLTMASPKKGTAKAAHIKAPLNTTIQKLTVSQFDAIIIIGGPGAKKELLKNKQVYRLVRQAAKQGKLLAAIGAAQQILFDAGIIDPPPPAPTPPIRGYNVQIIGKTIIGNGPEDAHYFAETIVKALTAP